MEETYKITIVSSNTPGVQLGWEVAHEQFPDLLDLLVSKLGHPEIDYVALTNGRGKTLAGPAARTDPASG